MQIYKVQLRKIFSRADVRISLSMFFVIPIVIAFLISIRSGIIEIEGSTFAGVQYAVMVTGLLKSLLLVGVVTLLIGTSTVAREIDTGLDCVYFTRVRKRESVFVSKLFAMDLVITAMFMVLLVSSIAGWLFFLRGTEFGTPFFVADNADDVKRVIFAFLRSYLEILALSKLFLFVSVLYKYNQAIVMNLLLLVGIKLLSNVVFLQQWMPTYIGDSLELFQYAGMDVVVQGLRGMLLLLIYALFFGVAGIWIYQKSDLVR